MRELLHDRREPVDLAERRIGDVEGTSLFKAGIEYTPPARGTWTIAHTPMLVPGAHEVYVCPGNCLRGVVRRCEKTAVSAEVVLDICGGKTLAATITASSAETLGLVPGKPACALFDAAHVIVAID